MPSLSRYRIIFAAVVLETLGVGAFAIQGCGDDNQVDGGDSGPDVTTDVANDVKADAKDGGQDVLVDSPADSPSDAPSDGPGPGLSYAISEATAICQNWFKCCPQNVNYNLNACIGGLLGYGWESNLPSNTSVYSRGKVDFDPDAGAACVAAINQFTCTQTATYWASVTSACQHVFKGTVPSGQGGCVSSFECAPNSFCDPSVDGGLCTSVRAKGQPCNDILKGYSVADEECSYLGSTQSGMFCDIIDNDGGYGAPGTCQQSLPNGSNCWNQGTIDYSDLSCTSLLCGTSTGTCGTTATYPVIAGTCDFYAIKDAGTD